ncbi:hypothetical protein PAKAF_01754, partial [Pseudomonas aeruginosa PAK]
SSDHPDPAADRRPAGLSSFAQLGLRALGDHRRIAGGAVGPVAAGHDLGPDRECRRGCPPSRRVSADNASGVIRPTRRVPSFRSAVAAGYRRITPLALCALRRMDRSLRLEKGGFIAGPPGAFFHRPASLALRLAPDWRACRSRRLPPLPISTPPSGTPCCLPPSHSCVMLSCPRWKTATA